MTAVGKGPHFLQKNPPIEFSDYGPVIIQCIVVVSIVGFQLYSEYVLEFKTS